MKCYSLYIQIFLVLLLLSLVPFIGCKNTNHHENELNIKSDYIIKGAAPTKEKEEITQKLLKLESEYAEMLAPIATLKNTNAKTYWFIVSWLKTNYKTPNWNDYYSDEWKVKTKRNGIDCSGFSRVMLHQIFDKKVSGSSQQLLDYHSIRVELNSLELGDLVFFKAPYVTNDRIVHVGVYLQDNYFAHATSTKTAALGYGLSINSLEEENWAKEFVTGGKVIK